MEPITTQQVLEVLKSQRFTLHDEKTFQRQLAEVLTMAGLPVMREVRLSPASIIDFMVGSVGIEVKIKASTRARDIYAQCERYCQFDEVRELLLITNKALGIPATLNGRSIYVLNPGRAWL